MPITVPETLDDLLGEGALEAFAEAHNLENDQVFISVNTLDVDGEAITWPPKEGRWIVVTPHWQHGSQPDYFKDDEIYIGTGLCNATDDAEGVAGQLKQLVPMLASTSETPMLDWCREWGVNWAKIPVPIDLIPVFEMMGFEATMLNDQLALMIANTGYNEKVSKWARWLRAGTPAESKPDWID